MDSIKIEQLLKDRDFDLRLELLAGENGLDRRVVSSRIQKPGLALSGFTEHIHKDRLQVFGNTEISYLATLRHDEALKRVRDLFRLPIACLVVTNDIVDLKKKQGGSVYGSGSEIIKHHMEIRGIGIINIKDLFGVSAVRERKKVEMVVELVEGDDKVEYDRLGVEEQKYTILDIEAPLLVIPVRPGRNLTTIVEVAARNHLLKLQGHHSAKEFQEKLSREIAQATLTRGIGDEVE